MAKVEELEEWFKRDIGGLSAWNEFVSVKAASTIPGKEEIRFSIYTDVNEYSITAKAIYEHGENGYLCCTARSRKPRAGEDKGRARDIVAGDLTESTWRKIVNSIISFELVRVFVR